MTVKTIMAVGITAFIVSQMSLDLLAARARVSHAFADIGRLAAGFVTATAIGAALAAPDMQLAFQFVLLGIGLALLAAISYMAAARLTTGRTLRELWREKDEQARQRRDKRVAG